MEVYASLNFGQILAKFCLPQTVCRIAVSLKACCAAQLAPSLDEWHGEGEELALSAPRGPTTGSGLQGVSKGVSNWINFPAGAGDRAGDGWR